MKITLKIEKEYEVKTLSVSAGVRYWEDATINGEEDTDGSSIPCRQGGCWTPEIDIDTGVITNWTKGIKAEIHYKICDSGCYYLRDAEGYVIASIEDEYVPKIMCPKSEGYGDYIIMDVDETGKIADWKGADINSWDAFGENE